MKLDNGYTYNHQVTKGLRGFYSGYQMVKSAGTQYFYLLWVERQMCAVTGHRHTKGCWSVGSASLMAFHLLLGKDKTENWPGSLAVLYLCSLNINYES